MNRTRAFRLLHGGRSTALVGLAMLGFLFTASAAKAGCGAPLKVGAASPIPFAVAHGGHGAADDSGQPASIVGLWHVVYTATYSTAGPLPVPLVPPGSFPFIQSYKTWHRDGTEFENAFLPPTGGNVCFGVWKQLENGNVKLHHIGLMFGSDGSVANVFTVDEIDRVTANGKTYSGIFDFKIFDPTDVLGTGTPLQELKGTTAGTRITVD